MRKVILVILFFVFLPGCSNILQREEKPAPYAVSHTIDGQPWSLTDHRGKVIVIDFWRMECGPCLVWRPWLKEVYEKFGGRDDFVLVGITPDKDSEAVRSYCRQEGMNWLQLYEPSQIQSSSIGRLLGVRTIPSVWLIHRDGTIEQLRRTSNQIESALRRRFRLKLYLEEMVIGTEVLTW